MADHFEIAAAIIADNRLAYERMSQTERRLCDALRCAAQEASTAASLLTLLTDPSAANYNNDMIAREVMFGLQATAERARGELEIALRAHLDRGLQ